MVICELFQKKVNIAMTLQEFKVIDNLFTASHYQEGFLCVAQWHIEAIKEIALFS